MSKLLPTLFPERVLSPVLVEDPISALTRRTPGDAAAIMHRAIKAEITASRLDAIRSLSGDQSNMVCSWLHNRLPGEQNMQVDTEMATIGRGFFSGGEAVKARTRVKIW